MSYTVTYENKAFPDDKEFTVAGLGVLVNGVPLEVDEALERNYVLVTRRTIEESLGSDGCFTVEGSSTLSGDAIKEVFGIDLSEISDSPVSISEEVQPEVAQPVAINATGVTPDEPDPLLALQPDNNPDS